jgi:thiamine pyrophosphate-dependent acetolactate synthase large subunit-like protein
LNSWITSRVHDPPTSRTSLGLQALADSSPVAGSGPSRGRERPPQGLYDAHLDHAPVLALVGEGTQRHGRQLPTGGGPAHARLVGLRYPMEVNLVGDSRATLQALLPHLLRKQDRRWRSSIEDGVSSWWRLVEERALDDTTPLSPQRLFWELSSRLPDGCTLTADSGSSTNWYPREVE